MKSNLLFIFFLAAPLLGRLLSADPSTAAETVEVSEACAPKAQDVQSPAPAAASEVKPGPAIAPKAGPSAPPARHKGPGARGARTRALTFM